MPAQKAEDVGAGDRHLVYSRHAGLIETDAAVSESAQAILQLHIGVVDDLITVFERRIGETVVEIAVVHRDCPGGAQGSVVARGPGTSAVGKLALYAVIDWPRRRNSAQRIVERHGRMGGIAE